MDPDYRPRLRSHVAPGAGGLDDALLGRRIALDPAALALAAGLDGTRTVAELEPEAAPLLRKLARLALLEGAGDSVVAQARAPATGRALVLPEARFQCRSSGACCQGYSFGPLTAADVARLEALDLAALAPGPWLRDKDGKRYLQTVDDRCVFLRPDQLCGIHAAHGAGAKPGFCQLYPVQVLATTWGTKFYDHGECASFAAGALTGTLLSDEVPRLAALLPAGRLELHHPVVTLAPGLECDYGHFLALTDSLCAAALTGAGVGPALAEVARRTAAFTEALRQFPLAPGEPERTLAQALATPAPPRAPAAPRRFARLATISQLLGQAIRPRAQAARAAHHQLVAAMHDDLAGVLSLVEAVARARAAPGRAQLTEPARQALALPLGADAERALRLSVRQQLFGQRALIDDRLRPASLRLAFAVLVAVLGAKLGAAAAGAAEVRLCDLDRPHLLALRVLRLPAAESVFVAYEDDAEASLDLLADLI